MTFKSASSYGKPKGKGVDYTSPSSLLKQGLKIVSAPQRAVDRAVWTPVREVLQAIDPKRFGGTASLSEALGLSGNEKGGLMPIFDAAQKSGDPLFGGNKIARLGVDVANSIVTDPISGIAKLGVGATKFNTAAHVIEGGAEAEKLASGSRVVQALSDLKIGAGQTYRKGASEAMRVDELLAAATPELRNKAVAEVMLKSGGSLSPDVADAIGYTSRLTFGHGNDVFTVPGTERLGAALSKYGGKASERWVAATGARNLRNLDILNGVTKGTVRAEIGRQAPTLRGAALRTLSDESGAVTVALAGVRGRRTASALVGLYAGDAVKSLDALGPEYSRKALLKLDDAGASLLADAEGPLAKAIGEAKVRSLDALTARGVDASTVASFGEKWDSKLLSWGNDIAQGKVAKTSGGRDLYHEIASLGEDAGAIAGWHATGQAVVAAEIANKNSAGARMIGDVEKVMQGLTKDSSELYSAVKKVAGRGQKTITPSSVIKKLVDIPAEAPVLDVLDGPVSSSFQDLMSTLEKRQVVKEKDLVTARKILDQRKAEVPLFEAAAKAATQKKDLIVSMSEGSLGQIKAAEATMARAGAEGAAADALASARDAGTQATKELKTWDSAIKAIEQHFKSRPGQSLPGIGPEFDAAVAEARAGLPPELQSAQFGKAEYLKIIDSHKADAAAALAKAPDDLAVAAARQVHAETLAKGEKLLAEAETIKRTLAGSQELSKQAQAEAKDAWKEFTKAKGLVKAKNRRVNSLVAQSKELERTIVNYQQHLGAGSAGAEDLAVGGVWDLTSGLDEATKVRVREWDQIDQLALDAVKAHEIYTKQTLLKYGVEHLMGPDTDANYWRGYQALEKLNLKKFGNQFMADPHLAGLFNPGTDAAGFDRVTQTWKAFAILRPGFSNRNFVGAYMNNKAWGIVLKDYRDSARALQALESGAALPEWAKALGVGEGYARIVKSGQLNDVTKGAALFGHGEAFARDAGAFMDRNALTKALTLMVPGREGRIGWGVATMTGVEDNVRLAQFIGRRRQGAGFDQAIEEVFATHFDYADLSNFDRKIRRFVPFWTYRSRSLPLQAQMFVSHPSLSRSMWLTRERNKADGNNGDNLPPWLSGLQLPFGNTVLNLNGYLPGSDLVSLGDAVSRLPRDSGQIGQIGSSFVGGPVLSAAEVLFNRKLYSGKSMRDTRNDSGTRQYLDLGQYGLNQVGSLSDLLRTVGVVKSGIDGTDSGASGPLPVSLAARLGILPSGQTYEPK